MHDWKAVIEEIIRGGLVAIVVIALVLVSLLETVPGQSVVAWLITPLSGGSVTIEGLRGDLPNALRADTIEVRDAKGLWLRARNVSLDWSALAALNDHIAIRRVSASKIALLRMPVSETSGGTAPRIDVGSLSISRIEIAEPVVGHPAVLTLSGSLHYLSRHQLSADVTVRQLDGGDRYRVAGNVTNDVANGAVAVSETGKGILGALIGMPGLGALSLEAQAGGDRAANTISFDLSAGALRSSGHGIIALADRRADLDFTAQSPEMHPSADLSWQALALEGHFHGAFDAPAIAAKLRVQDATANGVRFATLSADVTGRDGIADLTGLAEGVRIPGDQPDIFANAPVTLSARAELDAATRPVAFAVTHPLTSVTGSVHTAGPTALAAVVTVPSLAPFAALAGTEDLRGSARLDVHLRQDTTVTALALDARLKTEGTALLARMLGRDATLTFRANVVGSDIASSTVTLRGAGVTSDVKGSFRDRKLDYTVALGLPDVSRMAPAMNGTVSLTGHVTGPLETAHLQMSGGGDLASRGFAPQRIGISLQATGFPGPSSARVRVGGRLDNASIAIAGDLTSGHGSRNTKLSADWKSLNARADVTLANGGAASGKAALELGRLSDLAGFIGTALDGSLSAAIDFKPAGKGSRATLRAQASAIRAGDVKIGAATANGVIDDVFSKPSLALNASAQKIDARGFSGAANARLDGPLDKLGIALETRLLDPDGNPAHAALTASLNAGRQTLILQQLNGDWHEQKLHLVSPATIDFAKGIAVDRFAAKLAGGDVTLSGRLTPVLSASFAAQAIPARALEPFAPQLPMDGSLSASAKISGTLDAPQGTFTLEGRGLSARGISSKAIAPANLDAHGTLHGKAFTLHATLAAGNSAHLSVNGEAPLAATAPMNLRVAGTADLAIFNPVLMADGRQVRGAVTLDGTIAGTIAAPRVNGGGTLANGELQDFARGAHVSKITADIAAHGNRIDITRLTARAGGGTITGAGSIDLSAPGFPVDIAFKMNDARPVVSDRLTATLSGEAKISGKVEELLNVTAKIRVTKGEINLPDRFPPQVAVLDVRRRGQVAPPRSGGNSKVVLDVTLTAPNQFYVRGHGIDAEMGGRIHLAGVTNALAVDGGFDMRRGSLSLAGQTLTFTTGKISFDGSGVRNRLDPTLDFVAQTTSGGVTATLSVGGYASAPKIALSSSPQLPQDEVLARLLFQQSVKQLSPFQLAEIAQALASLGGIGSGFDALSSLRKGLGLDRLSVGGASGNSAQTTVEAGKYVARNVYIGARQNLSGGTQLQVQYDITRKLKAQATLSTVTNATVTKGSAAVDNGSSIGLSYQFEY
ncbi:MAG TPA: translocation/assembly module TamB domain-containing protein [Rhizomicrobium sp.]|nr:translocation/assembly module TamB domain-containing protein [Rhizomicrobium sp.]